MLQALIEHVANHDHSALRPLSHAAELWMIELRLAPISLRQRAEQRKRHVKADPMARCDIGHDSKTFGREAQHSWSNPASRGRRRAASRGKAASEQRLYVVCSERESWKSTGRSARLSLDPPSKPRCKIARDRVGSIASGELSSSSRLREAHQVFLGEFPRSTCHGRRDRLVPVARSDATF